MVELNCETDFVARNDEFKQLAKDLALHIMAANPLYVRREDVPEEVVAEQKRIFMSQVADKPQNIQEKIAEGKLNAWFGESVLLDQKFVKDETKTVRDSHPGGQLRAPARTSRWPGSPGSRSAKSGNRRPLCRFATRTQSDRHRGIAVRRDIERPRESPQRILLHGPRAITAGQPVFRRVLLKLSGESFCRPGQGGISVEEVSRIARQTSRVAARGVQLAIVVGGGNILRGAQLSRGSDVIKEATAHYMGMTATVINGLALQDALEHEGCATRLLTTIRMDEVAEPFIRRRALAHLDKGRVVILATGTGSPFVTTDTAAALRGKELGAEVLLKATRVDGIYSADPEKNPHAVLYEHLTFEQVMQRRAQGHGHDGDRHVPGEPAADPGVQLQERGKHRTGHRGRADRHLGQQHPAAQTGLVSVVTGRVEPQGAVPSTHGLANGAFRSSWLVVR